MITLNLIQGSEEWHKVRLESLTASEAPAMMNASKFQTRDELLLLKKTGIAPEVSPAMQRIFDKGHQTEAMARPIVEDHISEDLFPVTGSLEVEGLPLLASFDGLTMLEDTAFEHKLWNEELAEVIKLGELSPHHYWQLEQQLLVSGADKVIFVCSDGSTANMEPMDYFPVEGRREQLIAGWKQFKEDLANFEIVAPKVEPVAEVITSLPALNINLTGAVTQSNLAVYKSTALDFIRAINTDLQTDEDFANAENTIKFCGKAEKELVSVKKRALEQTSDIDQLFRTVDELKEEMRQKRLTLEKLVKSQKLAVRAEIIGKARTDLADFIDVVSEGFRGKVYLPLVAQNFEESAKGKRTIASLQNAVNSYLAVMKIGITATAKTMNLNLEFTESMGDEYWPLFRDIQTIITMECDQFNEVVKSRIESHKAAQREAEGKRKVAEQQRIETAKAQAVAEEKERAAIEQGRIELQKAQAEREKERAIQEAEEKKAKIEKQKPAKKAAQKNPEASNLPCPFCGGSQLDNTHWIVNDNEVPAIECADCFAGAPVDAWNRRVDKLEGLAA